MEVNQNTRNYLHLFGITPENAHQKRFALFSEINEIVFHGKGGYNWDTVYEMPIWLRKFTFNKLKEFYDKEQEAIDKQNNIINPNNPNELAKPNIPITYNTNVPTK